MIRRISTKWVLAVLVVVVVPFVGFAFFVQTRVADRLSDDVVRFHLLSMAADLAGRVDEKIAERRQDTEILALDPVVNWFTADLEDDAGIFAGQVERKFNGLVRVGGVYDFVVAIDRAGKGVAANTVDAHGRALEQDVVAALDGVDFRRLDWFARTLEEGSVALDVRDASEYLGAEVRAPARRYVGFAARIEPLENQARSPGIVLALMRWDDVQEMIASFGVRRLEEGNGALAGLDIYTTSYSWLWRADADTIIAHARPELYGERVSGLEGGRLQPLIDAARARDWGMYPDYTFTGVKKKAAFKRLARPEQGGFGWVIGVGADYDDIYAPVDELSHLLVTASAITLAFAVLLTVYIARRTTRPILELERHTRRIAQGDLDATIDLHRRDELGDLARAFNTMTSELKENREQLVQAEKDAAWREMARQVAHEIKNPLTPISLSASLLKRSYDEHHPDFDGILARTLDMIQRQVVNMREIARDFYAFAGEHRAQQRVEVGPLLDEVLELSAAWAREAGVEVQREVAPGAVLADPDELRRALLNLVANSIEAMPDGGRLEVRVVSTEDEVRVHIRDSGVGISPEIEGRLFEPYLTTRSSGTGLGLAIVRRVIEDMGGTVELRNAEQGPGAVARLTLPRTT
jgi:signal transduction histidine kinase